MAATWRVLGRNAVTGEVWRGVAGIWSDERTALANKVSSYLSAFNTTGWELESIASETEEFSYSFSKLAIDFPALLPEDFSFNYSPTKSAESGEGLLPSNVTLRGMKVHVPEAAYEITKRGLLGFSDCGIATITIPFDLVVHFTPNFGQVTPSLTGKPTIQLSSIKALEVTGIARVWNSWLSTVVKSKLQDVIAERIELGFAEWLSPLFDVPPSPTSS